jgi:hypothetical protein
MTLTRKYQWDTALLHDFIIATANTTFTYGSHDCCLFVADAVLAMTDVDIADDFRGKYDSRIAAFKLIKSITGGISVTDALAYCAKKYSMTEYQYPLMASRGDMVIVDNAGDPSAGIIHLNGRTVLVASETGMKTVPITSVQRAWKV